MEDYDFWSYKIVYYVYYNDEGVKFPAFCVEPAKQGIGTGYETYNATIKKVEDMYSNGTEKLNQIWRILNKGYMSSNWTNWKDKGIECDDDFYSATKIALHSLAQGIAPEDKYIIGDSEIDGNSVEDIQRRGQAVLNVAKELYYEGINGTDIYELPEINIKENEKGSIEIIDGIECYVQNYILSSNKFLKSYDIIIRNFPEETKVLDLGNNEIKLIIPVLNIKEDINGSILINNALIKTNPIFYCKSEIEDAQSYVTFNNQYEIASTSIDFNLKANTSKLKIIKKDKDTNETISGVKFEILDENKNKICEAITNDDGEIIIDNMFPQKIYIKEINAKEGYEISNFEEEAMLIYGSTSEVVIENEPKKCQIKIIKVDKDNNEIKLSNVMFDIYDKKGNKLETVITDNNGIAVSNKYYLKDYKELIIKEIKTQEQYNLLDRDIEVKLDKDNVIEIKIENEKIKEPEPEPIKLPRTGF